MITSIQASIKSVSFIALSTIAVCQLNPNQLTGKKEEDTFYNLKHELVKWQFINVSELYRISEMIDGAELYSRIEEKDDGDIYTDIINKKAQGILHSDTHQILQLV